MDNPHYMRRIRSFVLRQGHLSTGQERALTEFGPRFVIPYAPQALELDAAFGRHAPRILEIGFGMGQATAEIAAGAPETDFIGCEVHTPGVGSLLKLIGEMNLSNIRIVQYDVVDVLEQMLQPGSLDGAHVFFPDPCTKKTPQQAPLDPARFRQIAGQPHQTGRLSASGHRLGGLRHPDAGSTERRTGLAKHRQRIRRAPRLSPADQI